MLNLTASQKAAFSRVLARCNDCLPLIQFLEQVGYDVQELKDRYLLQRQQAETAMELIGITQGGPM